MNLKSQISLASRSLDHIGSFTDTESSREKPHTRHRIYGTPSYLRRWVLATFLAAFCVTLATLGALSQVSKAHKGLLSSDDTWHYLWTYGPTVVFSIIAAFWARTEYQAKQSAPWQAMLGKPASACKNVLLDYLSTAQPLALPKAIGNGHYLVAASISISLLFRLLVVFSTGLFMLRPVQVQRDNIPIRLLDEFRADKSRFSSVGSQPYDILNGIALHHLDYPPGTTADVAFQRISAPNLPTGARVSTIVDSFSADLDCEPATIHVNQFGVRAEYNRNGVGNVHLVANVEMDSPSCRMSNVSLDTLNSILLPRYFGTFQVAQCDHFLDDDGQRVVVTALEVHGGDVPAPDFDNLPAVPYQRFFNRTLARSTQLLCSPEYSMNKLRLDMGAANPSSKTHLQKIPSSKRTLPDLTAWDITNATLNYTHYEMNPGDTIRNQHPYGPTGWAALPLQIGLTLMSDNLQRIFDFNGLQDAVSTYYRTMTTQLVHKALFEQVPSTSDGTAFVNENRVTIEDLSLCGMETCLALMVVLVIVMLVLVSRNETAPYNLSSLSAVASVLARSHEFCQGLRGTGAASLDRLRDALVGGKYYCHRGPEGLSIMVDGTQRGSVAPIQENAVRSRAPFPGLIARIVIFAAIAMTIVALETVYQVSRRNEGLGAVNTDDYMHFLWTLVPAAVMISIELLFLCIDFNTRCLAPFVQLHQATGGLLERSMTADYLDTVNAANIFQSIRLREWPVLATTILMLITPLLTIVTSGLYSAIQTPHSINVEFQRETIFTSNEDLLSTKNDGSLELAGLILLDNLSYPRWTYEGLAFPELSVLDDFKNVSKSPSFSDSLVEVVVPALRPALSCRLHTKLDMQTNFTVRNLNINVTQEYCNQGHSSEQDTISLFIVEPNTHFGMALPKNDFGSYSTPNLCSNITYVWGHVGATDVDQLALLACNETTETVNASVHLQLPDLTIDTHKPPVTDESTARRLDIYQPSPLYHTLSLPTIPTSESFDNFFQALAYGKYATPIDTLGIAADNEKVADTVKFIHKVIMTQFYSNFTRVVDKNVTATLPPLVGNTTDASHWRLFQDAHSTRILEGLLGAILVLGILATTLMNTDGVLPKNPCSIAAVASLFADSNVLERYVSGSGKEYLQRTFANSRFFLGWVDDDDDDDKGNASSSEVTLVNGDVKEGKKFTIYVRDMPDGKV